MEVAYACDDAYIEQTTISLTSLFKNNCDIDSIRIWFIDMGLSMNSIQILENTTNQFSRQIRFVPFDEIAYDARLGNTGRHIFSVYAKIYFTRLPETIEKILYIDSDTVVVGSLKALWETNLTGYAIAGIETLHTATQNKLMELKPEEKAINDGVVLMNMKMWREKNLTQKCNDFIAKYKGCPPVLSEGTINKVCSKHILILEPQYNLLSAVVNEKSYKLEKLTGRPYYSQESLDKANRQPVIIHYLSAFYNRPWCKECTHPLKKYYLDYKAETVFADAELSDKKLPLRTKVIGNLYDILPIGWFCKMRTLFGKADNLF